MAVHVADDAELTAMRPGRTREIMDLFLRAARFSPWLRARTLVALITLTAAATLPALAHGNSRELTVIPGVCDWDSDDVVTRAASENGATIDPGDGGIPAPRVETLQHSDDPPVVDRAVHYSTSQPTRVLTPPSTRFVDDRRETRRGGAPGRRPRVRPPDPAADLLAYMDTFRRLGFLCLLCIAFVLLLRRPSPAQPGAELVH
jgi:hypothetical protein